jgi:pimeloyl-ACP methyl ester carboxylesterase
MSQPVSGKWKSPSARAEFVTVETSDGVPLHGAFYVPETGRPHGVALLAYHGTGANFYSGPPGIVSPALPARGYAALSMNLRCHGRFYDRSVFEPCELDIAAAVDFLRERGFARVVILGHSQSVTQVIYYLGRSPDPVVCGGILSSGHWDLAGERWKSWAKLRPENPRAGYEAMVAECQELVARGRGDQLLIVPWWTPDPDHWNPEHHRAISAKTFLSYYGPESNCRAAKWIGGVRVPLLIVVPSVVDTLANPEMSDRLRDGATAAPFVDLVALEGAGHFYDGHEQDFITLAADWLDKLRVGTAMQGSGSK